MKGELFEKANGQWPSILTALGGLSHSQVTDKHQPCPLCGGKDRYRFDDIEGKGTWYCSQCGGIRRDGGAGNGWEMLMRKNNWDFKRAAQEVERHLGIATVRPELPVKEGESVWYYNDDFAVKRQPGPAPGSKTFCQCWYDGNRWQYKLPEHFKKPNSKPLLNLGKIRSLKNRVIIVEGEKACDAAQKLFPTNACTTWSGGCKAHNKTDFSPIKDRTIALWPDADDPGREAMRAVADKLLKIGVQEVLIMNPPEGVPSGWDAADAESEWDTAQAASYLKHNHEKYTNPDLALETGELSIEEEDLEEKVDLYKDAPFRCLGHDRGIYFYLPRDGGQVISLSDSRHTKLGLLNLAGLDWWLSTFPKGAAVDWDQAADTLIKQCKSEKIYDPDRVRGRGAWYDSSRVIFHLGNRLMMVSEGTEPTHLEIDNPPPSHYFYEHAKAMIGPTDETLGDKECSELINIARGFSWDKPNSSTAFLLGWIVLAPVCGALDWRPHIWVTGGAGTGKTTILKHFMRPLLGGICQSATGGTTEAGLRGILKCDAIPVVFDEFEQNEAKDRQTVQNVLSLARIASSEGGKIYKGTTSGGANSFEIRSMFCVSSINVNLIQKADIDRFCVLSLIKDSRTEKEQSAFWRMHEQRILSSCTEDNGRRLISRTIRSIPVIRQNAKTFSTALGQKFGARYGDQNGTLLAGYFSLIPSGCKVITLPEALKLIERMDWEAEVSHADEADEYKCITRIMDSMVMVDSRKVTLRELFDMAKRGAISTSKDRDGSEDPNLVIARYGLKCHEGMLAVSHTNTNLQALLKDTPWSGNAYREALVRLPGAKKSGSSIRFPGMGTSRATLVHVDHLI